MGRWAYLAVTGARVLQTDIVKRDRNSGCHGELARPSDVLSGDDDISDWWRCLPSRRFD